MNREPSPRNCRWCNIGQRIKCQETLEKRKVQKHVNLVKKRKNKRHSKRIIRKPIKVADQNCYHGSLSWFYRWRCVQTTMTSIVEPRKRKNKTQVRDSSTLLGPKATNHHRKRGKGTHLKAGHQLGTVRHSSKTIYNTRGNVLWFRSAAGQTKERKGSFFVAKQESVLEAQDRDLLKTRSQLKRTFRSKANYTDSRKREQGGQKFWKWSLSEILTGYHRTAS